MGCLFVVVFFGFFMIVLIKLCVMVGFVIVKDVKEWIWYKLFEFLWVVGEI